MQKLRCITVIYFHIKNIPEANLNWKNCESVGLSSSSNLQVTISRVSISVLKGGPKLGRLRDFCVSASPLYFLFFCYFYAPCSLVNKPCAVQCALLGVSSVCWENWTDTIICRNLATQLSGRLLIIPNQITQKPEIKTSSQQRWGQTRTEWELIAPMGLIRNHGRGNRVGKCLPCTEAELKEAWNHMFGCLSIYHCKSRMYPSGILKSAAQAA